MKNITRYTRCLRKEIIHELGHTFGLYHCTNPICVMRSSTYVEDIDQKGWKFCAKCRKELGWNDLGFLTFRKYMQLPIAGFFPIETHRG